MGESKKEILTKVIGDVRTLRFCGPSDDPDEQTSVTASYHYLVTQLKRLAKPFVSEGDAARLDAIEVEINNIYSAYEAGQR